MPPLTKKRNCIRNKTTKRCKKSVDPDNTSNTCFYSNATDRCNNRNISEFVYITRLEDEYKISSSANKWIHSLEKSNKINKNFEKKFEKIQNLAKGFYSDKKENKNLTITNYIIHDILESAKSAAIDDDNEPDNIIQLKHIKYIVKEDDELYTIVYGK